MLMLRCVKQSVKYKDLIKILSKSETGYKKKTVLIVDKPMWSQLYDFDGGEFKNASAAFCSLFNKKYKAITQIRVCLSYNCW